MALMLCAVVLLLGGGACALFAGRGRAASLLGVFSATAAAALGLMPSVRVLLQPHMPLTASFTLLPLGESSLRLDALSAAFLVPALLLSGVCAAYGYTGAAFAADKRLSGPHWFFYALLTAGMLLVFTAADAFTFLLAWELMSLAPFFLITMNGDTPGIRTAAWIYLIAAHLGALFLLAFFGLLSARTGDLSFVLFLKTGGGEAADMLFMLALAGFGLKAGIMPLHIWLPEAHPAAPSHVSALMSGAMITTGVYGLMRALSFIGPGEHWWAWLLMALGAFSAFTAILFALVQRDIKRVLAYSSVENMGIVCLGLGIGLFCRQQGHTALALLAFTGVLLHAANHSLTKGMLFLCAGSILHGTGTLSLRFLGGLQKRMPLVGCCFALGAASIAALPPFNGFAGEFLIYTAMIFGGSLPPQGMNLAFWFSLFVLAGVGGFALLCFARVFALAFLGASRSDLTRSAHDPGRVQIGSILFLAALCVTSSLAAPWIGQALSSAAAPLSQAWPLPAAALNQAPAQISAAVLDVSAGPFELHSAFSLLLKVNQAVLALLVIFALLFGIRRRLAAGRKPDASPTWDCGYCAPTARMQYSGGSFSQPAAFFMRSLLRQKVQTPSLHDYFPASASVTVSSPDWMAESGFAPLFRVVATFAGWCKFLQHGRLNGYILYILLTLVALLAWKLN